MKKIIKLVGFLYVFTVSVLTRELPSYVHVCKRNGPDVGQCFINTVNEIMPYLIKGIPEMDVPSIDPLGFSSIKVDTGTGSVKVAVELFNGTVQGLKDVDIKKMLFSFDPIKTEAVIRLPFIILEGSYKMKGKILLYELNGNGQATFNISELITDSIWYTSTYMKKNKEHMNIDKVAFNNVKTNKFGVRFENLFGNDQVLTDTVNKAINDNIDTLREELEPIVKETIAEIIRDYVNRVYRLFPMDQLYPVE